MSKQHCTTRQSKTKALTGKVFGRLSVVEFAGYFPRANGNRDAWWLCECTCGTRKKYAGYALLANATQSCR